MKLHQVPNGSYVKLVSAENTRVPPAAPPIADNEVIRFDHIDGMYSSCYKKSGHHCHLVAWAEVEIVDGFPEEEEA